MGAVKILFGGDLHKRPKDISTIEGYANCVKEVQRDLMALIINKNIDKFICLGDWYDKGYVNDIAASLVDYDLDIKMMELLKGEFYGVIGNHIRLSMDSNPELHLIQPHPVYKSRHATNRTEQIIKTPDVLRVNNVQISFMHHDMHKEKVEEYKPKREPWAEYHIALFHTPLVIPNAQLANTQYGFNVSSNTAIARTLEGVDLAIVGDIHKPLGKFNIETSTGTAMMIVPGSLTNTDAGEANRHTSILLPLVTIDDNSNVTLEYIPFDLKTNLVTFKAKKVNNNKLQSVRGNSIEDLHDTSVFAATVGNRDEMLMSLNTYMNMKGYTAKDKDLVRAVLQEPENIAKLIGIFTER